MPDLDNMSKEELEKLDDENRQERGWRYLERDPLRQEIQSRLNSFESPKRGSCATVFWVVVFSLLLLVILRYLGLF
jgi:hypothetical protein